MNHISLPGSSESMSCSARPGRRFVDRHPVLARTYQRVCGSCLIHDPEPIELQTALASCAMAYWVSAPGLQGLREPTAVWRSLNGFFLGNGWLWGLILCSLALCQVVSMIRRHIPLRRMSAFCSSVVWGMMTAAMVGRADQDIPLALAFIPVLVLSEGWVYLRLGAAMRQKTS